MSEFGSSKITMSDWRAIVKIMDAASRGGEISPQMKEVARELQWKIKEEHGITASTADLFSDTDAFFSGIVKGVMAKGKKDEGPFTGGRDIMKKLVKKLRKEQGLPVPKRKPGYKTDGFGIMQKLVKHTPPEKAEGLGDGFDVMQQVKKHPVKIKKSLDPLETYPPKPIVR
jgi:hypothetical protein